MMKSQHVTQEEMVLSPDAAPDQRSAKVISDMLGAQAPLSPSNCFAACVRLGDGQFQNHLKGALVPGRSFSELAALVAEKSLSSRAVSAVADPAMAIASPMLDAFREWHDVWRNHADKAESAALEHLAVCVLRQFDAVERSKWSMLDVDLAIHELSAYVERLLDVGEIGGSSTQEKSRTKAPALLLPVPWLDLSAQVEVSDLTQPSPFDGDEPYEQLFVQISRALHRRSDPHLLLVSERGVGAATVLSEVARRAVAGKVVFLYGKRFVYADCRHVPPEESRERLVALLNAVAEESDVILCLDGLGALLTPAPHGNKAALLSLLPRFGCRLVGLISPWEHEELVAQDAEIQERFTTVEAPEPSVALATRLLRKYAAGLAAMFDVAIDDDAIDHAVNLSANYILHERLPGKALKILRRVCEDLDFARASATLDEARVTANLVTRAVANASGVPEQTLRGIAEKCDFESRLGEEIVGQPHVVREVAQELGLIKAGLVDPDKPASVMLFVGQTGTGKTEMAKALARFYSASKRLRTYTLGNFIEPHSVAGIIGVPPGYVGHDQGGRLVADLNSDPYCVFLLDEADKAHPDVLQPFLNLFDEGWIRDQRGVQAYAQRSIFILTTNVGQRMIADMAREGATPAAMATRMKDALAQIRHGKSNRPVFAPEFLARIKRIIVFQPLSREAMAGIACKLYRRMQETWRSKRQKTLSVTERLLDHIGAKAHEENDRSQGREGGRIVRKLMTELIESPVQAAIAERTDEYLRCKSVRVDAQFAENVSSDETSVAPPDINVDFGESMLPVDDAHQSIESAQASP